MKRSLTLFVAAGCAVTGWSQTAQKPASSPSQSSAAPSGPAASAAANSPSGPEAIAMKEPNKVVATSNGQPITAKQAYDILKMLPAEQRKSSANLQHMFEQLYTLNALAERAQREHLDQEPEVKSNLELGRDRVLAQAYMNKITNEGGAPTADPKAYYDMHKGEYTTASLTGIAVAFNPPGTPANPNGINRTEAQAKDKADDIEKKIKAGADIKTLARTESDDQRSAANGGSLGQLTAAAQGVPADLKDQVFTKLKVGEVSEPIRLPNAFYIIRVDSRNEQPYAQVSNQIEQKLKGEKQQAVAEKEIDKYKITVQDPAFFGSSSPSASNTVPSLAGHASATQSAATK